MPRPSATTWLLFLLVLLPTGALAVLGFQAADAYDAADQTRLRTELAAGREALEAACIREASALGTRLQALIAEEAAFVREHPGEEAVTAVVERLRTQGIETHGVRLVNAEGVGLWPREYVPSDEGASADLAPSGDSLLRYLRRQADRAYYGEGGVAGAEEVWKKARSRFQSPILKRLSDVEISRLRIRSGLLHPAKALAALQESWGAASDDLVALGRPYLLLRMAAAESKGAALEALSRDVQAGRTALVPLTTQERERLRLLTLSPLGSSTLQHSDLVALEAPVAYGVRLLVTFHPLDLREYFGTLLAAESIDHLSFRGTLSSQDGDEPPMPPGVASLDAILVGDVLATVWYWHPDTYEVVRAQKQRRWFLYGAVVLLFSVTLLGMGLTRRAVARERAARRMRDEFIANVTHEVRTPLTSVLLHSEILAADEQGDSKRREHAAIVKAQGKRLAQLVDDMLDFSALERGTRTLESVPVDLGAACREAVAPYGVLAEREGTQVCCDVRGDEVPAMGDPAALARVLANLLGNAWKHGRPARDGGAGRITIRTYENELGAHVEVRDDGPGIPAEERERIFARFGRGRRATKKEGAGIGLSLSRDLARAMGGELRAFEDEGETVFHLRLDALADLESELEMDA